MEFLYKSDIGIVFALSFDEIKFSLNSLLYIFLC